MKPLHTPGPWAAIDKGARYAPWASICVRPMVLGRATTATIAKVIKHGDDKRATEEDKANAALIAAAPDLFQALHELVIYVEHGNVSDFGRKKLEAAKAAIDKAEGL